VHVHQPVAAATDDEQSRNAPQQKNRHGVLPWLFSRPVTTLAVPQSCMPYIPAVDTVNVVGQQERRLRLGVSVFMEPLPRLDQTTLD
jgi:hypothetical protein